ncbi:MAG TPA: hypothetical protein VNN76_10795 [Bacteroidota bacterium]|nr:hypothetical protein [Bacteroidota bacterium]
MIQAYQRHIVPFAALLIAVVFTLSLFWCGDPDCLTGNSNEDCASLICSLLDKHDTSSSTSGASSNDCSCVCHVPTIAGGYFDVVSYSSQQYSFLPATTALPFGFDRLIYRPPVAS